MNTIAHTAEIPIGEEFDQDLPPDWDARVELGRSFVRRALRDFWELGLHLLETRDQYRYPLWGRYLDAIGVDDSSADKYVDLAFKYPTREALRENGHQTLKAALAAGEGPGRPRRQRQPALPAPTTPPVTIDVHKSRVETETLGAVGDLGDLGEDDDQPFGPPDGQDLPESAAEWIPTGADVPAAPVCEHPSPVRASRLLEELRQYPREDWVVEVLDMAEQAMGTAWLREQLWARCVGEDLENPAATPIIDLQERQPRVIAGETDAGETDGDELTAALAELAYTDSDGIMDDKRPKSGTCKLTADEEELRPQVEGPLAAFGFKWKPAKGNKPGCYWTKYGRLEQTTALLAAIDPAIG